MSTETRTEISIRPDDLRVAVVGFSGFMYDIVQALRECGLAIACVATQAEGPEPDSPENRALMRGGVFFPMQAVAEAAGAPLVRGDLRADETVARIKATGANLVISCSAPVLPPAFIRAFDGLTFNFHGSKVYRGRGGWSWMILNGRREDAVVLHWLEEGIDTGGAIAEAEVSWGDNAYPVDIAAAERDCFRRLIHAFAAQLRQGVVVSRHQPADRPYFPSLYTDRDGVLDWSWTPMMVERAVRAFGWPYAGPRALVEGSDRKTPVEVRIARARVIVADGCGHHPLTQGAILGRVRGGEVQVACGDGILAVESLRNGIDEIPAADLARLGGRFLKCA